ncbi:hypothetical protein [Sorangium sp. So ce1078]|uniref:hypothetical protein n=1 Tax=Sorangium sp. So ce1078 TaxID=3133329 RepID=UPI003F5F843F
MQQSTRVSAGSSLPPSIAETEGAQVPGSCSVNPDRIAASGAVSTLLHIGDSLLEMTVLPSSSKQRLSWYSVVFTVHFPPSGAPHEQGVQVRVSVTM